MTPEPTERNDAVGKTKVRTTITPGEVLNVDDAELLDLTRQGLLLSDAEVEKIEAREQAAREKAEAEAAAAEQNTDEPTDDAASSKRGVKKGA